MSTVETSGSPRARSPLTEEAEAATRTKPAEKGSTMRRLLLHLLATGSKIHLLRALAIAILARIIVRLGKIIEAIIAAILGGH